MQHKLLLLQGAALSSALLLAACNSEPEVVGELADPDAPTANELAEVELPASERDTGIYRCADNSVVYVTFYTDDTQVAVSSESNGAQTYLPNTSAAADDTSTGNETEAPAADGPVTFTNGAMTVIGTGEEIQYNGQSCHS